VRVSLFTTLWIVAARFWRGPRTISPAVGAGADFWSKVSPARSRETVSEPEARLAKSLKTAAFTQAYPLARAAMIAIYSMPIYKVTCS
jgi:hypothetical protein